MSVTVRFGAALRSLVAGNVEVEANGGTVREVLENTGVLERLCDSSGVLRRHFNIHINEGEDVRLLDGLNTNINPGDVVTVLSAIAGGVDATRRVWLRYPKHLIDRPVIWEIGREYSVVTNIRQASITDEIGLVGLEFVGNEDEIERALGHCRQLGITVEPIELDVVE